MVDVVTSTAHQLRPSENPAFLAWRQLEQGNTVPDRIEMLKGELNSNPQKNKGLVCLLVGVGLNGSSVVGKRSNRHNGLKENFVYKHILPFLPYSPLDYYGIVEEEDSEYVWLFLEYAGNTKYSSILKEHRLLATKWLAQMHISANKIESANHLPSKGAKYYKYHLRSGREGIREILRNSSILASEISALRAIINHCDLLERNWTRIEEISVKLPNTLVHGDFVKKNLRIRNHQSEMILLPFDWEDAGWGSPATDIMHIETESYWCLVRDFWSSITQLMIKQSAIIGQIFWSIDAINWELPRLQFGWKERSIRNMRIYDDWLVNAIQLLGLN
jgi:thiamine kinase-like enzyme